MLPAHDRNIPASQFIHINYSQHIGPIVANKCVSCHQPIVSGPDTTLAGGLDLTAVPDTTMEGRIFPRGYVNLSGASNMMMGAQEVVPPFPRRSKLIDYVLGLGAHAGPGPHPTPSALTPEEKRQFNLWVMLGAQYK